jgi:flagellar FliL protein
MSEEKKPKKRSKLVIIIVAVVLGFALVSGSVFAGYFFASKNAAPAANTGEQVPNSKDASGQVITMELDEFLVNLADEGKAHYLKTKIVIGYRDGNENLKKELETKKPVIRDSVNNVLRTKKTTDLKPEGEEVLKKELLDKINGALNFGKVTNVYFPEILVQ